MTAEIHPAARELQALAAEMRPDWDQDDLRGALASAQGNGWSFARACLAAVRLLAKPESEARDLLAEVAKPGQQLAPKGEPVDTGAMPVLADARAVLARQTERWAAEAERAAAGDDRG